MLSVYSFSSSNFFAPLPSLDVPPFYVNDSNLTYTFPYIRLQVLHCLHLTIMHTVVHTPVVLWCYSRKKLVEGEKTERRKRRVSSSVSLLSGTNLYLVFRSLEINDCECDHREDYGALN